MKKKTESYSLTDIQIFSRNLQKAVVATGLTPYVLAKKIGVNKDAIKNILKGDRDPQFSTVINIVKGMQLSMDKLLELVENTQAPLYPVPTVEIKKDNIDFVEKITKMNEQDVELLGAIAGVLDERRSRAVARLLHAVQATDSSSKRGDDAPAKAKEIEKPKASKSLFIPDSVDLDDLDGLDDLDDDNFGGDGDFGDDDDDFGDDDFDDDYFRGDGFDDDDDDDLDDDD